MTPGIIAFSMFALVGVFFLILGIHCFFSNKPSGFWANAEQFEVTDVRAYNNAMGKMWIVVAILFTALGIPLLNPENILPVIFVTIIGTMLICIGIMIFFSTVIEPKYKKK